jgi:hypothetical protein
MELPFEDESKLFLVWVHVQRWSLFIRLGYDSRLHIFANRGLDELLWVCGSAVLLHLSNFVERHFFLSYVSGQGYLPLLQAGKNV